MEINILVEEGFEDGAEVSWLQSTAEQVLLAEAVSPNAELSLVVTGEEKMRELNRLHRGIDEPTDVLSFAMLPGQEEPEGNLFIMPPDGMLHLGEVIISYPQALKQAGERQHPVKKEILILLVHGILHILGYDHDEPDEEARMKARESEILQLVWRDK